MKTPRTPREVFAEQVGRTYDRHNENSAKFSIAIDSVLDGTYMTAAEQREEVHNRQLAFDRDPKTAAEVKRKGSRIRIGSSEQLKQTIRENRAARERADIEAGRQSATSREEALIYAIDSVGAETPTGTQFDKLGATPVGAEVSVVQEPPSNVTNIRSYMPADVA